jgi:hypothetical protein
MSTRFDCLPLDVFEIICDFLDGHQIRELLSCGSKRLSSSLCASVRRFRFLLRQIETFPFFAFNLASPAKYALNWLPIAWITQLFASIVAYCH